MRQNISISKILKILLKDLTNEPTITTLAKDIGLTRVGAYKILKKIQAQNLIILSKMGSGKTHTYKIRLNWDNPLVEKSLTLYLAEDALKNKRWINNFEQLENKVDFLIIYGSIINSQQQASDIDILGVTSNKNKFVEIENAIKEIQKTQIKKIHSLNFTQREFKQELEKPNKAFVDAVKKGIVLFGQEKFIKFIKSVIRK